MLGVSGVLGVLGVLGLLGVLLLVRTRGRVLRVRVVGWSMQPAIEPGDEVLARRVPPESLAVGDLVVLAGPHLAPELRIALAEGRPAPPGSVVWDPPNGSARRSSPLIVKRIAAVGGPRASGADGEHPPPAHLLLLGDNPEYSVDSRHYGSVPADRILGRVVRHLGSGRADPGAAGGGPGFGG
ncbi:S26 family signal peptidase [Embleya hyalina]|uniref:S26 family signal peptidase n=1 Tax=Embleya hyalina TaxID=516124 RepID=UPI001FE59331|nr:S26 family signal peptidase [Embleya hyalina]